MPVSNIGNHTGTIVATALKAAKTGSIQVCIQFEDEESNTITAFLATSEAAWPYTEKKLAACGFVMADNDFNLERLNDEDCPLIGMKEIPFSVKAEEYEGVVNHKVSWIGGGGGISERMDPLEAKKFSASLRQRLITAGGKTNAAPAPTGAKKPAPWAKGKK